MGRRTVVSIKTVMKKYKMPAEVKGDQEPVAMIAGKAVKAYAKSTDQGTVPYFRGVFWGKNLITDEEFAGEVCSLPAGASDALLYRMREEKMLRAAGADLNVEFAFLFTPGEQQRFLIVPLIEPRSDAVLERLRGEVLGLIEVQRAIAGGSASAAVDDVESAAQRSSDADAEVAPRKKTRSG